LGGDFGLRKADVTTIPPIIARGVLIDVAGSKNVEALPSHYEITVEDLPRGCLSARNRKRAATGSGTPLERAAGRPWPCSIKIEPRGSEAALRVTRVGQAEGRQAADHSRRNIVKLAPCQLPDGGFLVVCEIFPARHVAQEPSQPVALFAHQ
jgi:hypothetical protein